VSTDLNDLLSRSQFVFEGTVQATGKSQMADLPADTHTAIVRVDQVLHPPAVLARAAGTDITVQLAADAPPLAAGAKTVLFTTAVAFGQHIAVAEVGRTDPGKAGPSLMAAGMPATLPGSRPGRPRPVLEAAQQLATAQLRAHAADADAVVVGRIMRLEKVGPSRLSEHDPDWWRATINVEQTEKGDARGQIQVLYPNSSDVHWARVPKLHAGDKGLWILHSTEGPNAELAPYCLLDSSDAQPADHVDLLRPGNS